MEKQKKKSPSINIEIVYCETCDELVSQWLGYQYEPTSKFNPVRIFHSIVCTTIENKNAGSIACRSISAYWDNSKKVCALVGLCMCVIMYSHAVLYIR